MPRGSEMTIDTDLPCAQCGYNLRTLLHDGVCSECGAATMPSVHQHLIRTSELGQLRVMGLAALACQRRGVTLALVGTLGGLVGLCYSEEPPVEGTLARLMWLSPFVVLYVLSAYAAWNVTNGWSGSRSAMIVRCVLAAGVASIALRFINTRFTIAYFGLDWWGLHPAARKLLDAAAEFAASLSLAWPLGVICVGIRLASLSARAKHRALATSFAIITLAEGVHACICMAALSFPRLGSGELMGAMVGPTGSSPFCCWVLGMLCVRNVGTASSASIGLLVGITAVQVALAASLFALRRFLTRAIRLGELPASSSRSSPSSHPPT